MDKDRRFDSVYSKKVRAGKRRTYFFDVRRTKGDDFYLTLTESTKKFEGNFERHKIFLYKEDFNRFLSSLEEVIAHIKTELMPDYDYEEFDRKEAEWDARRAEEGDDDFRGGGGGGRRERTNDGFQGGPRRERKDDSFQQPQVGEKRKYRGDDDNNDNLEGVNDNDEHHEDDDMSW